MKAHSLFLIVCLSALSCKEVAFPEPQPRDKRALKIVPRQIQGKYLPVKEDGELSVDTIVIHSKGYRFGYFDPSDRTNANDEEFNEGVLSDSLVLKAFRGYYFFSFREDPEWLLRVVRREKNGDLVYMAPEQEGVDFKDYIKKIGTEVKVDSFEVQGRMVYLIDPPATQLVRFIEKGYFSKAILKKIE